MKKYILVAIELAILWVGFWFGHILSANEELWNWMAFPYVFTVGCLIITLAYAMMEDLN